MERESATKPRKVVRSAYRLSEFLILVILQLGNRKTVRRHGPDIRGSAPILRAWEVIFNRTVITTFLHVFADFSQLECCEY
jgi:hypothetical protein